MHLCEPQISLNKLVSAGLLLLLLSGCSVIPKDYPPDKPFVFKTNISLDSNFTKAATKEQENQLKSQLKNQLDDSLRVRTVYKPFYKGINRQVMEKPPAYDTVYAEKTVTFMKALLNSQGYFRNHISYDTTLKIKPDAKPPQNRTTVNFLVSPEKLFTLDSISYIINHTSLNALTEANKNKSTLQKGKPFSKQLVSEELNRLVTLYRENGYMRFTFDELVGIWDTLNRNLLRPTFDPFDMQIIEELRRRRDSPTANIEIRLRPGYDFERLQKYFVGHTTIYPDYTLDTTGLTLKQVYKDNSFTILAFGNKFKSKFIMQNIYFRQGDLYNQSRFLKTIQRFNRLGAWRLVNIEPQFRPEADTVDFTMYLSPAKQYSFTTNLEASSNTNIYLDERLLGLGVNFTLLNRNFGRSANQSALSARYSSEVFLQGRAARAKEASLSYAITFPKPIPNVSWLPEKFRDNFKTTWAFTLGNIVDRDLYNLTSLNTSWGYNFSWRTRKDRFRLASFKIPNIEYAFLDPKPRLDSIFEETPSYRYMFNTGLVLSIQAGIQLNGGKPKTPHVFRFNFEESGLLIKNVKLKVFDSLFSFIKFDAEFIKAVIWNKTSLVCRIYSGVAIPFETETRTTNVYVPFYKQYFAGGPNSMRAWGIRTLGPGSALKTRDSVPLRFGDFQLETNVEYRFPLTVIAGVKVNSCLFTDIGNVWFLKANPDFPDGNLTSEFYRDLAVGIGTGLRIDFDFFRLRLDYGLKVKNPTPEPYNAEGQNKWFYNFKPFGGIVQIGINYPFAF